MASYLLIESRDPLDARDVDNFYGYASSLKEGGNEVTLFLVQNGVLPARGTARDTGLDAVSASGVTVLADDFSLRERGIGEDAVRKGVSAAPIDTVIDHLGDGAKVVWH